MKTRTRITALVLATVAGSVAWSVSTKHAVATTRVPAIAATTKTTTTTKATTTTTITKAAPTTSTTVAPAPAGNGPWSDHQLLITPSSLGAVQVGMSLKAAQRAAGYTFNESGDGFIYPTTLPSGYPHDFVGEVGLHPIRVSCVGAVTGRAHSHQNIVTPEGFRLGDSVRHFLAIYGSQAVHVPAPPTGMTTDEGYVVAEHGGYLAFIAYENRIVGIEGTTNAQAAGFTWGAGGRFDQNSCTG